MKLHVARAHTIEAWALGKRAWHFTTYIILWDGATWKRTYRVNEFRDKARCRGSQINCCKFHVATLSRLELLKARPRTRRDYSIGR